MSLEIVQNLWQNFANSFWPHLLVPTIHVLTLTLPPLPYRKFVCTVITALLAYPCFVNPGTQDTSLRYLRSSLWMYHLASVAKIALFYPERDFWRTDDEKEHEQRKKRIRVSSTEDKKDPREHEAECMPFRWQKFKWALGLLFSYRGVGWNWQVKGVPKARLVNGKEESKVSFCLRMVKEIALSYIALDVVTTFLVAQHFSSTEQRVRELSVGRRFVILLAIAVQSYASTYWIYSSIALVRSLIEGRKPKVSSELGYP
jgi:hypothetical protein